MHTGQSERRYNLQSDPQADRPDAAHTGMLQLATDPAMIGVINGPTAEPQAQIWGYKG